MVQRFQHRLRLDLLPRRVQNGCAPGAPTPDYALRTGRETGAKRGDFPLQTSTMGAWRERAATKKSTAYRLLLPLPRLGSGVRIPSPAPRFQ